MGCSPCSILFHVLSFLQASSGGGRRFYKRLAAPRRRLAPLGGTASWPCRCVMPCCLSTGTSSDSARDNKAWLHGVVQLDVHPPPGPSLLQALLLWRAQVALAVAICIIVGVKLQDVSVESGTLNFNYSCLLGTSYGSSSLCTVRVAVQRGGKL